MSRLLTLAAATLVMLPQLGLAQPKHQRALEQIALAQECAALQTAYTSSMTVSGSESATPTTRRHHPNTADRR